MGEGRERGRKKGECEICKLVGKHNVNHGGKSKISSSQVLSKMRTKLLDSHHEIDKA